MKKQKNKETLNWVNRPNWNPETSEDRMGDIRSLPLERLTLTFAKRKIKVVGMEMNSVTCGPSACNGQYV